MAKAWRHAGLFIALLLGCATHVAALPLQNGNFPEFTGWSGVIHDGFVDVDVDPSADPHFELIGGGFAELRNDDTFFEVALFQAFDLPSDARQLWFDFEWIVTNAALQTSPTDPEADLVQAALLDPVTFDLLADLFPLDVDFLLETNSGTAVTDISHLAGRNVLIEFLLFDGDFDAQDILRIGNIRITQVPSPATVALLIIGLMVMASAHRLRRT